MGKIGAYILSIAAASIFLGILQSLLDKKSSCGVLLRLIGGIFLTFTVLKPVSTIDFNSLYQSHWDFIAQGQAISKSGQFRTESDLQGIIKKKCEAYILDKGLAYQTPLSVEVTLSQDELPVPTTVHLHGSVSPYVKRVLQRWLHEELGIPKESQVWSG